MTDERRWRIYSDDYEQAGVRHSNLVISGPHVGEEAIEVVPAVEVTLLEQEKLALIGAFMDLSKAIKAEEIDNDALDDALEAGHILVAALDKEQTP